MSWHFILRKHSSCFQGQNEPAVFKAWKFYVVGGGGVWSAPSVSSLQSDGCICSHPGVSDGSAPPLYLRSAVSDEWSGCRKKDCSFQGQIESKIGSVKRSKIISKIKLAAPLHHSHSTHFIIVIHYQHRPTFHLNQ